MVEAAARLQLPCQLARDREREAPVSLHELDEVLRVDLEQARVSERAHGRRARRPRQEPELAERRSRAHLAQ